MVEEGAIFRCESCNKTVNEPNPRYILNMRVVDHSGEMYLGAYNDHGKLILGIFFFKLIQGCGAEKIR